MRSGYVCVGARSAFYLKGRLGARRLGVCVARGWPISQA